MPRLLELTDRDALPPEAHEAYDYLAKTRGSVRGGFAIGLRSPDFAQRIAHVGTYVRFESPLPRNVREPAGVAASAVTDNPFELNAHSRGAKEAGVSDEVIEAARTGGSVAGAPREEALAIACARELTEAHRLSDATFKGMLEAFGEAGVIDLIGTVGYYALLAVYQNGVGLNDA